MFRIYHPMIPRFMTGRPPGVMRTTENRPRHVDRTS